MSKKNVTSLQLQVIERNRVASHFEMKKRAIKKNKVTNYSKIKSGIEDINSDSSNIKFFIKE